MSEGATARWIGDDFWVIWTDPALSIEFRSARVLEDKPVELHIVFAGVEVCWDRVSPASARSRGATIQQCQRRLPFAGWAPCFDAACRAYVEATRTGETSEVVTPLEPSADSWLIPDWLPRHYPTVVYGEGGAGKGFWALGAILSALTGAPFGAWRLAACRRVLWLDWEYGRPESFRRRLWHFLEAGVPPPGDRLRYMAMTRSLGASAPAIRREIARHDVDFIVVDSLAPASGADPESANASVGTLQSLTSLQVTSLLIAHLSKAGLADSDALPYGSIFNYNLIRSAIRLASAREQDGLTLTAIHRKTNEGPLVSEPVGFRVRFHRPHGIAIEAGDADRSRGSLEVQIEHALQTEGDLPLPTLVKRHGKESTVRDAVARMQTRGVVSIIQQGGGRGKPNIIHFNGIETHGKPTETHGPTADWTQSDLDA